MSVRDEIRELLDSVPEERLDDVRIFLEQLREADGAWSAWETRYGGAATDKRIRDAVAEADTDPGPSIPHDRVATWLRSWGSDAELQPPA